MRLEQPDGQTIGLLRKAKAQKAAKMSAGEAGTTAASTAAASTNVKEKVSDANVRTYAGLGSWR